jgi:hypothetical protein
MKFLMYLVFFIIGLAVGTANTENTWKNKMKVALEEREEVHKIMIDVENTVTKKEAYDEFLRTLWDTCIDGGGFYIQNEETNEKEIFKCSKEDDNEFTVARR